MTVRVEVPVTGRPGLIRARLLHRLQARWSSKVVTVTAGPGFGKTTLLAQAYTENLLDPRGLDLWISARQVHSSADALARDLAGALGISSPGGRDGHELADAVAARAPTHVNVFIDDAHLIGTDSSGAGLLADLLAELPSNGHLVLGGRAPLPIGVARLVAQGQAVQINERDMAFDDEELAAFAGMRLGLPLRVAASGGWPAMAELLVLAHAEEITVDFLWQELLAGLDGERRRQLAVLSTIGRADDARLSAASESAAVTDEVVRNLPMTSTTADGWTSLHDLWAPALHHLLNPAERSQCRRLAALDALARADFAGAFSLYADAGAWDEARSVVRQSCRHTHPLVPFDVMRDWLHRFRAAAQGDHPEVALLVGVLVRQSDPSVSAQHFELAARDFRLAGDADSEAGCLFQLGQIYWWHSNDDALAALVGRLVELATGGSWLAASVLDLAPMLGGPGNHEESPEGEASAPAMASALPAPGEGSTASASAIAAKVHPEVVPLRSWLLARDHLFSGRGDLALAAAGTAAATVTPGMTAVSEFLVLQCRWAVGERDEVIARLDSTVAAVDATGLDYFTAADLAMGSMWLAVSGDPGRAAEYEARAGAVHQHTSVWAEVLVGLAGVMERIDANDEPAAASTLQAMLARAPLHDPSSDLAHRPWIPLSYVLIPDSRAHWDGASLHGGLAEARRCARILVAWREHGDLSPARAAGDLAVDLALATMPAAWAGELAAVMGAGGHRATALRLLERPTTVGLRRLSALAHAARSAVSVMAADLTGSLRRRPSAPVTVELLGPLRVLIDGTPSSTPELSRRRVRELLLLLVEHGKLARERILEEMWPDLPERAARANLRTTLSYLNKVLEPNRAAGEEPVFIVEVGDHLQLREGPDLRVDIRRFEALIDEASDLERTGAVTSALACYVEAAKLYRGPYLADAPAAEWAIGPRDRCRLRFCAAAVRAGELSVARGDAALAEALARQAVSAEPWSEPAHRLLAEALLVKADRAGARRAYAACLAMLDELGADPTTETVMLGRRLDSGARTPPAGQRTTNSAH